MKIKKSILTIFLFSNSILALGNYIDMKEYRKLKIFLKEEQQTTFNNLMKNLEFAINTLDRKLKLAQNKKEVTTLEDKKDALIKKKNEIIKKLYINILEHPENYTKAAMDLKENINKLVDSYSEVKEK
ncbi:Uncharacterised protein [Fusobacterium necrogenes]|uniref:Uncharacterized protein n=1 Tax=Fusobacterium necrogenes TaxID=858 RepID=A0A377GYI6_9FUSO|nr:hypothetical protein [Fusobacterium necrogenes]STO31832.1 Uncharacterised protein [Fusobacterium necrogenes]